MWDVEPYIGPDVGLIHQATTLELKVELDCSVGSVSTAFMKSLFFYAQN